MYASGISPKRIAEIFNEEDIPSPGRVAFLKLGRKYNNNEHPLWEQACVRILLKNIAYLGHLAQQKDTAVSYKNHKRLKKDQSEWIIIYNNHEPIISQELWDKVQERMKSRSHGKSTALGYTHPLSGFLYCADCGAKMKMCHAATGKNHSNLYNFNCGAHMRLGKSKCFSHFIPARALEEIILDDIRTMAQRIVIDEKTIRADFIRHNAELTENTVKYAKRELKAKQKRIDDLSRLIRVVYEDRVNGKMPEEICFGLIEKYSDEQKTLTAEIESLENKIKETESTQQSADDFIRDIKKYLNAPTLTREMCYELIDRIIVGGLPKITGKERVIEIVYKVDIASVLRHKLPQ